MLEDKCRNLTWSMFPLIQFVASTNDQTIIAEFGQVSADPR
jgi:hypothetical protein